MGKASSAKKVARAARAGGRVSARQPRGLLFPTVLSLVVLLGVSLVVYAREDRRDDDLGGVPQIGDHIHQAIGVNVCGDWLADLPEWESQVGIHTHADGVIHIHPYSQLGVGANATLDRFFDDARDEAGLEVDVSATGLTWMGETYEEGEHECEGVEDPQLRMAYWGDVQDESSEPTITTGGFGDTRLTDNGAGITLFYGDPTADIPRPPNYAQLAQLGAADGSQVPDPGTPEEHDATSTTAAGDAATGGPGSDDGGGTDDTGPDTTAPDTTAPDTTAPGATDPTTADG